MPVSRQGKATSAVAFTGAGWTQGPFQRIPPGVSSDHATFRWVELYIGDEMLPIYMDVSLNGGFSPQLIHFNRVFRYKPSILVPLFLETPI